MTDEELVKRLRDKHCCESPNCNCDEAADRIEALTNQLEAARADAKEAEAYAEELQGDLTELCRQLIAAEDKLAKAVEKIEALEWFSEVSAADAIATRQRLATLAEIEGEKG